MLSQSTKELYELLGGEYEIKIVPFAQNVPDKKLEGGIAQFLTIHETANEKIGMDARAHNLFIRNGGGPDLVSFTYGVDSKRVVQNLLEDHVNYAQGGDGRGNRISWSIEVCVNQDGIWHDTIDNVAKLIAAVLTRFEKPINIVVQHNIWYGKDCPHNIRHTPGTWAALLVQSQVYMDKLKALLQIPPKPAPSFIFVNNHKIQFGFLDLWNRYGIGIMGLPESDEYVEIEPDLGNKQVTYQDFENVVVQWYQGIDPRICAGIRKYKYHQ